MGSDNLQLACLQPPTSLQIRWSSFSIWSSWSSLSSWMVMVMVMVMVSMAVIVMIIMVWQSRSSLSPLSSWSAWSSGQTGQPGHTGQTSKRGQTDLIFKLDFSGNLEGQLSQFLRCFLVLLPFFTFLFVYPPFSILHYLHCIMVLQGHIFVANNNFNF